MFFAPLSKEMYLESAVKSFLQQRNPPHVLSTPGTPSRIRYIADRTLRDYEKKAKTLRQFFGTMRLCDIQPENLYAYQDARATGNGFTRAYGKRVVQSKAGATKINAELGFLKQMMILAGAWSPELAKHYRPFQVPDKDVPRALSYNEQQLFLSVASSRPRWHLIWWYSLVALDLTFSSDEMRTIRQGDINLQFRIVGVNRRHGKNNYRRREIPIADGACIWALERLLERAKELLGSNEPHHYLFPRRVVRGEYTGDLPTSETGFRKLFEEVRIEAELPWFCLNMWRHTAITRLAEAGVSMPIIQRRAGHSSPKMTEHYTHISEQAERLEMERASRKKPVASVKSDSLRRRFVGY
jgi:integrase